MTKYVAGFGIGVGSVFYVEKTPGRIYVEATALERVKQFLRGVVFVYINSVYFVPIVERIALLDPASPLPPFKIGELVKVRNGLYLDDIGEIVDVGNVTDGEPGDEAALGEEAEVTIKLKSRQRDPRGLKRKRGKFSRPDPFVLDKANLLRIQAFNEKEKQKSKHATVQGTNFIDLEEWGFMFYDSHYTNDGYFLLKIRPDRVERVRSGPGTGGDLDPSSLTTPPARITDCESQGLSISKHSSPKFIAPGDPVRINRGPSAGAVGRIIDLTPSNLALVDIGVVDPATRRSVLLKTNIAFLDRTFEIGDHVEVKFGEWKGRIGVVSGCNGDTMCIVNTQDLSEA